MFDPTSRYANIETAVHTQQDADGRNREVRYVRRRFIPRGPQTVVAEHTVVQGDRLDNITARYLGDPAQFWRICDANDELKPSELTAEIGRVIKIAMPEA